MVNHANSLIQATDELFTAITRTIASPHTAITKHDKLRAARVFLAIDDYLIDALPEYCEGAHKADFGAYAANVIDEIEVK